MPTEHIKVYQERTSLSIWFWILPLLLLAAFLTFFFTRRHNGPAPGVITQPIVSTLPDLGSLTFDPGQPTLADDGQASLDRAAEAMRGNPNVRLRVEGYVDPKPRATSLAQQRSLIVARYLEAKGIDRSRLTGASVTEFHPVPSSGEQNQKGDSRRVELYVQ